MEQVVPRRIMVTGAGGFVGSHLCEALLAQGHQVVGVEGFVDSYAVSRKVANLSVLRGEPNFSLVRADLRIDDLQPHIADIDVVIHEAAMPGLPRSWTDLEAYVSCNIIATQRLLDAALHAEVSKFVQISTSSVYGAHAVGGEDMPLRPVSPYGVTKLAAENLVRAYLETHGLPAVILRYFSIFGPRQRPDMAYHIFTKAMAAGRPLTIFGDGSQTRANTYVEDCVRGTIQAIAGGVVGEIYNIGGGESITLLEAVECIADALKVVPDIRFQPGRPGDQLHTHADTSKAKSAFGYEPLTGPWEGLRAQVAWQRGMVADIPTASVAATPIAGRNLFESA